MRLRASSSTTSELKAIRSCFKCMSRSAGAVKARKPLWASVSLTPDTAQVNRIAALGVSCFFLSQTYSGGGGGNHGGIPRGLRENATHLIFFRNKSENVFKKILEEIKFYEPNVIYIKWNLNIILG